MAKNDDLVSYSKQRDPKGGQDKWARLKMWKDPANTGSSNPLAGNNPMNGSKGKALRMKKRKGMDAPDGAVYDNYTGDGDLNKDSDSTA